MHPSRGWILHLASIPILLAALTLLPAMGFAGASRSDCVDTDLSPRLGPVRSQGYTNLCVDNTSADLIGYKLGIQPPDQVSAWDVALNYLLAPSATARLVPLRYEKAMKEIKELTDFKSTEPVDAVTLEKLRDSLQVTGQTYSSLLDSDRIDQHKEPWISQRVGYVAPAVFAYNFRGGACLESQLPSQSLSNTQSLTYIKERERAAFDTQLSGWERPFHGPRRFMGEYDLLPSPQSCYDSGYLFPRLRQEEQRIADVVYGILEDQARQACSHPVPIPEPLIPLAIENDGSSLTPAQILEVIQKELKRKNIVAISYDVHFMRNASAVKPLQEKLRSGIIYDPADKVEAHASTIVGSRWNSDKRECELKIRNSWGPGCAFTKGRRKGEPIYKPQYRCEGGNIWVPEQDLAKNLFEIVFLP